MSRVLVTGGCGFIGTNLVKSLAGDGHEVVVVDDFSRRTALLNRPTVEGLLPRVHIIEWNVANGDLWKYRLLNEEFDLVFHLAAQVAVTDSVRDPEHDFNVNALGTLNALEWLRRRKNKPVFLFTSTNKVYGALDDHPVSRWSDGYRFSRAQDATGISEQQPLDFHSPYGCSKGAADQYVRDYSRVYGVKTIIFRMSCIYGPHQYGTEDQGWVAHFAIQRLLDRPVKIFGDGLQVRDILHVDDLVCAMKAAVENVLTHARAGLVLNIGGGPGNALSVIQAVKRINELAGSARVPAEYGDWRPGDQKVYVSDVGYAKQTLGWEPTVGALEGIKRLYCWLRDNVKSDKAPA